MNGKIDFTVFAVKRNRKIHYDGRNLFLYNMLRKKNSVMSGLLRVDKDKYI